MTDGNSDPQFGQDGSSGWDGTGTPPKAAAAPHWHSLPIPTGSVTTYDPSASGLEADTMQAAVDAVVARLTVGDPTVVISNGKYNAFPILVWEDHPQMYFRDGTDHNVANDGRILEVELDADTGALAGATSVVFDHPTLNVGPSSGRRLRNGRTVLTYCTQDGDDPAADNFIGYTIKKIAGVWQTPVATATPYGTGANHREVPVGFLELPDDRILTAFFVRTSVGVRDKLVSFISSDECATFPSATEQTIVDDADSWSEAHLETVAGRHWALLRNDSDKDIYLSEWTEADGWSTPVLAFSGWGFPRFHELASGIVATTGRQDNGTADGRAVLRTNYTGRLDAWSDEVNLEASGLDMQYADFLPIPGTDRVLVAVALEHSSTDARISTLFLGDIADQRYSNVSRLGVASEDGAVVAQGVLDLRFPADSVTVNGDGSVSVAVGSMTSAAISALGFVGPILMTDGVSNPPEPLTTEDGTDYLYMDLG